MMLATLLIWSGSREPLSNIRTILPWLALFVLVALLFAAAARGAAWAPLLLIVIAAADQAYWGLQYIFGNPRRPLMTIEELAKSLPAPESARPGDLVDARLNNESGLNNLILHGLRVWHGYVGLPPVLRLPDTDMTVALARNGGPVAPVLCKLIRL